MAQPPMLPQRVCSSSGCATGTRNGLLPVAAVPRAEAVQQRHAVQHEQRRRQATHQLQPPRRRLRHTRPLVVRQLCGITLKDELFYGLRGRCPCVGAGRSIEKALSILDKHADASAVPLQQEHVAPLGMSWIHKQDRRSRFQLALQAGPAAPSPAQLQTPAVEAPPRAPKRCRHHLRPRALRQRSPGPARCSRFCSVPPSARRRTSITRWWLPCTRLVTAARSTAA